MFNFKRGIRKIVEIVMEKRCVILGWVEGKWMKMELSGNVMRRENMSCGVWVRCVCVCVGRIVCWFLVGLWEFWLCWRVLWIKSFRIWCMMWKEEMEMLMMLLEMVRKLIIIWGINVVMFVFLIVFFNSYYIYCFYYFFYLFYCIFLDLVMK